jgi:hypothetical protein
LHGTSLIASKTTYPHPFDPLHGDLGGNRLAIKAKAGDPAAMKLHFFWDRLVFESEGGFGDIEAKVTHWRREKLFQRDRYPELAADSFLTWAEESRDLAQSSVYSFQGKFLDAVALPLNQKVDLKGLPAPVLPEGYHTAAREVASRRMVLAGYRIADGLQKTFLKE